MASLFDTDDDSCPHCGGVLPASPTRAAEWGEAPRPMFAPGVFEAEMFEALPANPGIFSFEALHSHDDHDPKDHAPVLAALPAHEPWITREGKLGGAGFLSRPFIEQRAVLDNCVAEYGYRSCLGSILALERNGVIQRRYSAILTRLRRYLVETYGRGVTERVAATDAVPALTGPLTEGEVVERFGRYAR